jgi:hypothetical protein
MRVETKLGKVIVRTRDKRIFRGFSKSELINDKVHVIDAKGNQQEFDLEDLKAVFFVKDFDGDPSYREVRFVRGSAVAQWLWAQATFFDGEVIEGRLRNGMSLFDSRGVFLWLSDEEANNEVVFVVRSALRDFRIVGIA